MIRPLFGLNPRVDLTLSAMLVGVLGFAAVFAELCRRTASERLLRRRAAGAAHDINNLLTVIQGHAQFLSESPDRSTRADAREIFAAVVRASNATRQLLLLSRGRGLTSSGPVRVDAGTPSA